MEDRTKDSATLASTARPTETAGASAGATAASAASAATPTMRRATPPQQAPKRRRLHPLWLAIGAAALFGLIFGVGNAVQGAEASTTPTTAPSGESIEQTTINTIQKVDPSVVQIQSRGQGARGGVGSGEILTTSGYIVTNSHVVHGFTSYMVLLANGQQVPATLVGDVPSQDLAVLKISASNLTPIAIGDSSQTQVGEYAIAMGSPLGLEQSATTGIISALNREGTEVVDGSKYTLKGMIQTSAPINPGNSGGALVNLKGQLIGIPTLAAVDPSTGVAANGIGYAISSSTMETVVQQLTNGAA